LQTSEQNEKQQERLESVAHLAGKYLTFRLAGEVYGLEILKVQEIIRVMDVTRVPRTPEFIRGVINLRGKVIPVVDLGMKFGLGETHRQDRTCIVVVRIMQTDTQVTMGILVDEVNEVLDVAAAQIEPSPEFGVAVDSDFILGMGKVDDKVVMLLDAELVLTSTEVGAVAAVETSTSESE
jgi:purine-binding chemotaxis protein CheW